jgi:hypothetical protein
MYHLNHAHDATETKADACQFRLAIERAKGTHKNPTPNIAASATYKCSLVLLISIDHLRKC